MRAAADALRDEGLLSTPQDYTALISGLGRRRLMWEAMGVLEAMTSGSGPPPNVIHFNAAISACEGADWARALALLDRMRAAGVPPDAISFNAAIGACAKGEQWGCALDLLRGMAPAGIAPTVVSFGAAIDACARGGQWESATELLLSMPYFGVPPNVVTFNGAIRACKGRGAWQAAIFLLELMEHMYILPDAIGWATKSPLPRASIHVGSAPLSLSPTALQGRERAIETPVSDNYQGTARPSKPAAAAAGGSGRCSSSTGCGCCPPWAARGRM